MSKKLSAAPGSWESPIHASQVANGSARLADLRCNHDEVYWLESMASEQGRMTIMHSRGSGPVSILPQPFNVRSKVHEYGGAPYCLAADKIFFVNSSDQGIYCLNTAKPTDPELIYQNESQRFADLVWIEQHQKLIAVCEDHSQQNISNYLVSISSTGEIRTLVTGEDFYAYPRYCEQSSRLCWVSWQHPYMPWDKTELWMAKINHNGELEDQQRLIPLENDESIVQPMWHANGDLYYVSDSSEWWNLYRIEKSALDNHASQPTIAAQTIRNHEAEHATPLWVLGMQNYALDGEEVYSSYTKNGVWELEKISLGDSETDCILKDFSAIESVCYGSSGVFFIASTPRSMPAVYKLDSKTRKLTKLSQSIAVKENELSTPESIFTSTGSESNIQAFYYAPYHSRFESAQKPPLIVLCHGGPTGQTTSGLNYKIQYWTNRGFAVVDINYRGSTGFGKTYRHSLYKNWGVHDVEDMSLVVEALIKDGKVDADKIIIKGGSAGGYTVLAALAFTDLFRAGVSLYGVADLELLAKDTHKFEQHYLDQLIGPYPEQLDLYRSRSPINSIDAFSCPILLFQGLEDKVVPPNQARAIEKGLDNKKIPVALIEYADEGHGFRSPENIEHMLEAELYFYQQVFGMEQAIDSHIINIKHLE